MRRSQLLHFVSDSEYVDAFYGELNDDRYYAIDNELEVYGLPVTSIDLVMQFCGVAIPIMKIESTGGDMYDIDVRSAKLSKYLAYMMKYHSNDCKGIIEIRNITSNDLWRMIIYLEHHRGVTPPRVVAPIVSRMKDLCDDPWDANFVDCLVKEDVYSLAHAAYNIELVSLFHLCIAKLCTLLTGARRDELEDSLMSDDLNVGRAALSRLGPRFGYLSAYDTRGSDDEFESWEGSTEEYEMYSDDEETDYGDFSREWKHLECDESSPNQPHATEEEIIDMVDILDVNYKVPG